MVYDQLWAERYPLWSNNIKEGQITLRMYMLPTSVKKNTLSKYVVASMDCVLLKSFSYAGC
jgi:hypothetical protein